MFSESVPNKNGIKMQLICETLHLRKNKKKTKRHNTILADGNFTAHSGLIYIFPLYIERD